MKLIAGDDGYSMGWNVKYGLNLFTGFKDGIWDDCGGRCSKLAACNDVGRMMVSSVWKMFPLNTLAT